jgi:hypothetical protein
LGAVLGAVLGTVLGVSLLATGCAGTVDGTARRASLSPGTTVTSLALIMPGDAEIRAALGNDMQQVPPPRVGGIELLPDGIRSNSEATPIECIGTTTSRLRVVYEKAPVRAAAVQDYWNYGLDVVASSATAAAIRLASADDAQHLFGSFVQQWQSCAGKTVTLSNMDSSRTLLYSKVTDVHLDGPLLSATVLRWDNHHTPPFPVERAVGVDADVLADVEVAIRPHTQTSSRAIDLAKIILRKLSSAN